MSDKKRRIPVDSQMANTIMPDGRPIFAWENEIESANVKERLYDMRASQIKDWALAQGILLLKSWDEPNSDTYKILITIDRSVARLTSRADLEKAIVANARIEVLESQNE